MATHKSKLTQATAGPWTLGYTGATTAEHTPGPWHTTASDPNGYVYANDTVIVEFGPQTAGKMDTQRWANARLIAAAPELLAALKGALRYLVTGTGFPDKGKGRTEEQQAAYDACRAAIDKAEKGA